MKERTKGSAKGAWAQIGEDLQKKRYALKRDVGNGGTAFCCALKREGL
jgi:hypothetical protein